MFARLSQRPLGQAARITHEAGNSPGKGSAAAADDLDAAYYDTLADIASTLAGGVVEAAIGTCSFDLLRRRRV
jgi:hypothetical protein